MSSKWASRKFWICIAAFLGSLGTGITGLCIENEAIALTGGILMVVSGAIYAACEAYVDGASIKASTSEYKENITIQSTTKEDALAKAAADKVAPTPAVATAPELPKE